MTFGSRRFCLQRDCNGCDQQLEAWVLSIVDRVCAGLRIEDDRVELKSEWPEFPKGARRIAGHANALRGDAVLWIVGLQEGRGVVPFAAADPASWIAQLGAHFDGLPPIVNTLFVPTARGDVYALLFDTSRRPFVVENPAFNNPGGGPVELEVPWREGTRVRSARREDLIRLLVPVSQVPHAELLSGYTSVSNQPKATAGPPFVAARNRPHLVWLITFHLYLTPSSSDRTVLPVHRAQMRLVRNGTPTVEIDRITLSTPTRDPTTGLAVRSETVTTQSGDAILTGPGRLTVLGEYFESLRDEHELKGWEQLEAQLALKPAEHDHALEISAHFVRRNSPPGQPLRWILPKLVSMDTAFVQS